MFVKEPQSAFLTESDNEVELECQATNAKLLIYVVSILTKFLLANFCKI